MFPVFFIWGVLSPFPAFSILHPYNSTFSERKFISSKIEPNLKSLVSKLLFFV